MSIFFHLIKSIEGQKVFCFISPVLMSHMKLKNHPFFLMGNREVGNRNKPLVVA